MIVQKGVPCLLGQSVKALEDGELGRRALVIGNGPSRRDLDLDAWRAQRVVLCGCNWIYRDYPVDYLGTMNGDVTYDLLDDGWAAEHPTIVPRGMVRKYLAERERPSRAKVDMLYEWTKPAAVWTGPMMLALALYMGCTEVVVAGFDGGTKQITKNGRTFRSNYATTREQIRAVLRWPRRVEQTVSRIGCDWLADLIPERMA